MAQEDFLDKTERFLAKREGIDKTLKVLCYSARLAAALGPKDPELAKRLELFAKNVGASRRAYRLGKFLQNVNSFRHSKALDYRVLLELLADGGEGLYFFLEQLTWLSKAGVLSPDVEERFSTLSSSAELVGYVGSVWLSVLKLKKLKQLEGELEAAVEKLRKEEGSADPATEARLAAVRFQRRMRVAFIVQDLLDAVVTMNDITGGRFKALNHPALLAFCDLASGCISFYKNWTS